MKTKPVLFYWRRRQPVLEEQIVQPLADALRKQGYVYVDPEMDKSGRTRGSAWEQISQVGRVYKSHLLLQLVMWGDPGSSHVWHQRTWPHREMELHTVCCSSQRHNKSSEIPPWVLLGDCIQPKIRLRPLSEEGWVLPRASAYRHTQCLISMD